MGCKFEIMYYQDLLDDLVDMCRDIIGEEADRGEAIGSPLPEKDSDGRKSRLTGVYLHGSMAMGCFNPEKSDIDIIVVIEGEITDRQKMRFMEQVVRLNGRAPAKGLELSIVNRNYCKPFVYPTPYELHFSPGHLQWFLDRPQHYIQNMKGVDKDLAAHFAVINRYGIALYGRAVPDVFGEVPGKDYADSIWYDVENAGEDIEGNATYVILNLCRAAAFLREGLCLSKADGGGWGLKNISEKYRKLILGALSSYRPGASENFDRDDSSAKFDDTAEAVRLNGALARQFAEDMLGEIRARLCEMGILN